MKKTDNSNKNRKNQADESQFGHTIFIDYSKEIIQYMIIENDKFSILPLSEKLPQKFSHIKNDFLLSSRVSIKRSEIKNEVRKEVPGDIIEFLLTHSNSRVLISKNSQRHLHYGNADLYSNKDILSNRPQNNVLTIKGR